MTQDGIPRARWIRATLWVGLAGAALVLWYQATQRITVVSPDRSAAATPVRLRDADAQTFELLATYRGRVLVVNAWASWCGPCRTEQPRLNRLHRDLADSGLVVLGINVEGPEGPDLERLVRDWGIPYRVARPDEPLAGTAFAGQGVIPHTWIVDRQGRIRASKAGLVSEGSLRRAVETLLAERSSGSGDGVPGTFGQVGD